MTFHINKIIWSIYAEMLRAEISLRVNWGYDSAVELSLLRYIP